MATPVDTPPDPGDPKPTYANIASSSNHPPAPLTTSRPKRGLHKGEPAGYFPIDLLGVYCKPFHFAMVGKFSHGRPEMKDIHSFFKSQDFHGQYSVGLLNFRHILVNFNDQQDFHRFYSRMLWYVGDYPMRVFKWTPDFHPERESSLVPVWFKFPNLPIHFFNKDALFFLATLFGTPFRLDSATTSLKRPSVARIQIEVDLLKPLPGRLWIGTGEGQGFWQRVEPDEDIPLYCSYCWHVGHSEDTCTVNHPELLANSKCVEADKQKQTHKELLKKQRKRQEYRQKQIQPAIPHVEPNETAGTANIVQEQKLHSQPISNQPIEISSKPLLIESDILETPEQVEVLVTSLPTADDSEVFPITDTSNEQIITANSNFVNTNGETFPPIDINPIAVDVNSLAADSSITVTDINPDVNASSIMTETSNVTDTSTIGAQYSNVDFSSHAPIGNTECAIVIHPLNHDQQPVPKELECPQAAPDNSLEPRQETHHQERRVTLATTSANSANSEEAKTSLNPNSEVVQTSLNPNAPAFFSPTPSEHYNTQQQITSPAFWPLFPYTNEHISVEDSMGFHDTYYQASDSDKLEEDDNDEDDYFDITDGSEDTVRQKRKGKAKSKATPIQTLPTKEYLEEQSHKLGKKIKKRGRPPGSRNRTFFDMIRTMETRSTKSTSS